MIVAVLRESSHVASRKIQASLKGKAEVGIPKQHTVNPSLSTVIPLTTRMASELLFVCINFGRCFIVSSTLCVLSAYVEVSSCRHTNRTYYQTSNLFRFEFIDNAIHEEDMHCSCNALEVGEGPVHVIGDSHDLT